MCLRGRSSWTSPLVVKAVAFCASNLHLTLLSTTYIYCKVHVYGRGRKGKGLLLLSHLPPPQYQYGTFYLPYI